MGRGYRVEGRRTDFSSKNRQLNDVQSLYYRGLLSTPDSYRGSLLTMN